MANDKEKEAKEPQNLKDIEKLLIALSKNKGSDLHLKANLKPIFRIATVPHEAGPRVLGDSDVQRLIYEILSDKQKEKYEQDGDIDFAYNIEDWGRYRINVFRDRGSVAVAVRRVNTEIPSFEQLHLPPILKRIALFQEGLIIVAGPTGSGKSTTLASILQYINNNRRCHIITIEDPIEYLFKDGKSFVNQREVGLDVKSFNSALKYIVRQDPDVIMLGEMRDPESLEAGLMASETGHLVLGTVHASSAHQTISRIMDLFPAERQEQIRQALSFNLKSIICQKLLPGANPEEARMVPTIEILLNNPSIQKLIQEKEDKKIQEVIRGAEEDGMQDFNRSLLNLINEGLITKEVAFKYSPNAEQLKMYLQGIFLDDSRKIIG